MQKNPRRKLKTILHNVLVFAIRVTHCSAMRNASKTVSAYCGLTAYCEVNIWITIRRTSISIIQTVHGNVASIVRNIFKKFQRGTMISVTCPKNIKVISNVKL